MASLDGVLHSLGVVEDLSAQDTLVHRIDPRAKVIVTAVFIAAVTSFGRYDFIKMFPFLAFPMVLIIRGNIPLWVILKRVLIVSPFAILIGIFNPLLDKTNAVAFGPVLITGGWISFGVILFKFLLTVSVSLLLIATTGFNEMCFALEKLKVPDIFVNQLLFMYRYIFLMLKEAARISRAHSLRSFRKSGMTLRVFGSLVGHLLLRTLDRAQRIYNSMVCRGFTGEMRLLRKFHFRFPDFLYMIIWCGFFSLFRFVDVPRLLGNIILRRMG